MNDTFDHRPDAADSRTVFSVSQLNRRARQLLETHLPLVWVEGEISNFSRPSSGHWYFTLKDSNAQVRCAMFRNRNQLVRTPPKQGQQVTIRARVSLYEGRGDYQLIAEHMEDAGHGALQRAYDELKQKLLQEGLFNNDFKQPLPSFPRHLGIITSPTGAAIRDVLHVLQRRFPALQASLFPVPVQGSEAAGAIVRAIDSANRLSDCDALILCRGGGSLEDLWSFNEESVARAVFASDIPIICGVGHETDTTIADFVADVRAPTPSAAAELATPDQQELLQQLQGYELWMKQLTSRHVTHLRQRLAALNSRIEHPAQRLQNRSQQLDNLEIRLKQQVQSALKIRQNQHQNLNLRLNNVHPGRQLSSLHSRLEQSRTRMNTSIKSVIANKHQKFAALASLLDSVSPLTVLQRGYSVTRLAEGVVLREASQTKPGDTLITQLASGTVLSRVEEADPEPPTP